MNTLFGMKVITSPFIPDRVPVMEVRDIKLSDGTSILTPEFRAETNRMLLELFGTKAVAFVLNDRQAIAIGTAMKQRLDEMIERELAGPYWSPNVARK
jgi:hypothetical protein